ncbi:MAG TPA: hypothetical protein VK821_18495 [Dehalococcoidia bacterium]|nr:hypothetical protein [Dehalococcoidia bacterium]
MEAETFRRHVTAIVGQVEHTCALLRATPDSLPAPSLAAYRFLKDLDLADLPISHAAVEAPASAFRIKNLLGIERRLSAMMWGELPVLLSSSDAVLRLTSEIKHHAATIEGLCARHGASPPELQLPSRRIYCWLKFLADGENLRQHLSALERASIALTRIERRPNPKVQLLLLQLQSLWTSRQTAGTVVLKVSEGFAGADTAVWEAIIDSAISGRSKAADRTVAAYVDSEEFGEVLAELDGWAEAPARSMRGRFHNLDDSFERVNRRYFGGSMPRPKLTWNRALTSCKFGHYQQTRDTVMLSLSLDDAPVPFELVDFVMYHELLHKQHGARLAGGRRFAHTPAFRTDERRFDGYADAQRQLESLARAHRRRIGRR